MRGLLLGLLGRLLGGLRGRIVYKSILHLAGRFGLSHILDLLYGEGPDADSRINCSHALADDASAEHLARVIAPVILA